MVHRLILDGRQCVGVAVDRGNGISTVWATREVILAGGAINSPALLQHSGIGDPAHLTALDLPVSNALPGVGRNLQDGYLINFYPLRPESRGTLQITSPYPEEPPAIDPNYLSAPADVACMRDGVRLARRIGAQAPLSRYDDGPISPDGAVSTDEQIDAWVRAGANTIFHPVGTCAMGAEDDPMAVVDAELKVRGMEGLRVVDASVMPRIIGGNTSAPTIMIAEKAADMILGRPAPPRVDLAVAA